MASAFDPISIGNCQIPNRIGLGPLNAGLLGPDGKCDYGGVEFYEQYFKEDIGVVFIGGIAVSHEGRSNRNSLHLDDEAKCNGIKLLVEKAHEYQTKIVVQLMHAGRQTNPDEIGAQIVAPSAIPCPVVKKQPKDLTEEEIKRIVIEFGESAKLVEKCNVDLLELHGAHGYLISEFLSPYSNHRSDQYGGSLENRFRFLVEILTEIKNKTTIPTGIRFSCIENVSGGLEFDELLLGVKRYILDYISFISISAGVYSANDIIIPKRSAGNALWKSYSLKVKQEFSIPVMLIGNILSVDMVNDILGDGAADIVLMARALLTDPKLITKTKASEIEKIQECIDCKLCKYHTRGREFIFCPFNKVLVRLHRELNKTVRKGA
jgi:2,4-dienoyl-CoA reductase-like NADH-dependent reductase (Old Yellow Enzyme family)